MLIWIESTTLTLSLLPSVTLLSLSLSLTLVRSFFQRVVIFIRDATWGDTTWRDRCTNWICSVMCRQLATAPPTATPSAFCRCDWGGRCHCCVEFPFNYQQIVGVNVDVAVGVRWYCAGVLQLRLVLLLLLLTLCKKQLLLLLLVVLLLWKSNVGCCCSRFRSVSLIPHTHSLTLTRSHSAVVTAAAAAALLLCCDGCCWFN